MISPASPADRSGFTLIELLIVLAVLGLLLTLASPLIRRSPAAEARAAAVRVADLLRATRTRAVRAGDSREVTIELAARRLLGDGEPIDLPERTELTFRDPQGRVAGPVARILFLPDGSASGGTVDLHTGELRIEIAVDWITGRVRSRER